MSDCKIEMIDGNIKSINGKLNKFNHIKIIHNTQFAGALKIDELSDFVKK